MGNDVRNVSNRSRATLLNPDAIAIDQDALGVPGVRVSPYTRDGVELWARRLSHNNSFAIALVNKGDSAEDVTLNLTALVAAGYLSPAASGVSVYDVFAREQVGVLAANGSWCFDLVEPHGVKFLRLLPQHASVGIDTTSVTSPSRVCPKHPPSPPGPAPGPFPPMSPQCPSPGSCTASI